MRNGFLAKAEHLRAAIRMSEQFLGRFAADCLMSRSRALDRIVRDLRFVDAMGDARRRRSAEK